MEALLYIVGCCALYLVWACVGFGAGYVNACIGEGMTLRQGCLMLVRYVRRRWMA